MFWMILVLTIALGVILFMERRASRRTQDIVLEFRLAQERENALRNLFKQTLEKQIEQAALVSELLEKQRLKDPIPGSPGVKPIIVLVGGKEVALRPLSGKEWAASVNELPGFLMAYLAKDAGKNVSPQDVEDVHSMAKKYILASAIESTDVSMLTVPEAGQALKVVSRLNGFDQALVSFFQRQRAGLSVAPDGASLRHTPKPAN